jgi:hypothetical protein
MKRRVVFGLLLALGGLALTLLPLAARGQAWPPRADCPPLPAQGPARTVAVYAATALDVPGVICVRAVNGISPSIVWGGTSFFLQKWADGAFQNFSPSGGPMGVVAAEVESPVGQKLDHYLFAGQPAPSGRYRACFRYTVTLRGAEQVTCSEEFTLP